jgi:C4-dicarboxylate transporter DctM subunit
VIKSIAPDIPPRGVIWSMMPFVVPMIFAVIVLCIFPGIATGLADAVLGR